MLIQIPDTTYVRDTNSMALINKDQNGLSDYMKKRHILAVQKDEINTLKSNVEEIKEDMQDIKKLLLQLMDKTDV